MSLVSLAVRIIARNCISGQTWAEARVMDQPIDPIMEVVSNDEYVGKPAVALYTQRSKGTPCGLETQGGPQEQVLMAYVYLPPNKIDLPDGVAFEADNQTAGIVLNAMGRQIDAAMHFGNEAWVTLWRKFVLNVEVMKSQFVLVEIEDGVRVPCLEISYEIKTIAEPDFGAPLYGYWLELDTELRGMSAEGILLADLFKGLIEAPSGLEDFAQFQMNFGLTDPAFASTGLDPLAVNDDGTAPLLEDVPSEPDITVTTPDLI